jgi:nucleotide-binding universal stress UspA family protein
LRREEVVMLTVQEVARISLKNILFPTDFSPASSAALPFALALARVYGSTVAVTHVLPSEHRQQRPAQSDPVWQAAQHELAEWTREHFVGDTPCKTRLECGDLGEVIPEMIREHGVDLVVLGTNGRRGVSKLVLGSSAEKIYRSAPCPVLTVGPKVQAGKWTLRSVLCPVDVVEDPGPFLHYALALAEKNKAEFIVLQAVPLVPWQHRASVEVQMRQRLETMIPEQAKDWCTPQFLVRWEHPAEAVLLAAAEREADLIVMGVRKARAAKLSAHLPWPVASEVVSRAPCPVLTVRV